MTREARQRATTAPSPQNREGEFRHLIHRLPVGPRDATFLAATFLTADFLAGDFWAVLAVDFLAVDALAGNFLGSVPTELFFSPSRAGSILQAPAPGANRLSCPSLHRTRYWTRRSPSITSMISPSRGGPPTRRALTTMRSPFLATGPPSLPRPLTSSRTGLREAQTSGSPCNRRVVGPPLPTGQRSPG